MLQPLQHLPNKEATFFKISRGSDKALHRLLFIAQKSIPGAMSCAHFLKQGLEVSSNVDVVTRLKGFRRY